MRRDGRAELGAVGLNTEDPVFSCPSLQPPPSEAPPAPHLSPSPPQKNSDTEGGDAIFPIGKPATLRYRAQLLKMKPRRGPTTTGIRPNQHWPPVASETERDDGTTAERVSRPARQEPGLIDRQSQVTDWPLSLRCCPTERSDWLFAIHQQRQGPAALKKAGEGNVTDYFSPDDVRASFLRLLSSIGSAWLNRENLGGCEDVHWLSTAVDRNVPLPPRPPS
eukprot:superscaffoldBa00005489_g20404